MKKRFVNGLAWMCLLSAGLVPCASVRAQNDNHDLVIHRPSIPTIVLAAKMDQIDREIKKINSIEASNVSEMYNRKATVHIRKIARALLDQGVNSPDQSCHFAAIYGMKIADQTKMWDAMFAELITQADSGGEDAVRAARGIEALQRFLDIDPNSGQENLRTWSDVHLYLSHQMSDLLVVTDALGRGESDSPWATFDALPAADTQPVDTQPAATQASDQINREVAALKDRLEQTKASKDVRIGIAKTCSILHDAANAKQFRLRIEETVGQVDKIIKMIELLDRSPWISQDARSDFETELARVIGMYNDPRQRRVATNWLNSIFALKAPLYGIVHLKDSQVNTEAIDGVFLMALAANPDRPERDKQVPRERVLDWLGPAVAMQVERLEMAGKPMPEEFHLYYKVAEQQAVKLQRAQVATFARQVSANPALLNDAGAVATSLSDLRSRMIELRDLAYLPQALDQAMKLKPKPALGLTKRIKTAAQLMGTDKEGRDQAADDIHAFCKQVRRYIRLPGEKELREDTDAKRSSRWPIVGKNAESLLDSIDTQRESWINAWATDDRPMIADARIHNVARLMRLIRDLEGMRNINRETATLNRWPCIELDSTQLQTYVAQGLDKCKEVVEAVANAGASSLSDERFDDVIPPWPVVVFAAIHTRLSHTLGEVSNNESGALATLLDSPPENAWLWDKAEDMAYLSRNIDEKQIDAMMAGTTEMVTEDQDPGVRRRKPKDRGSDDSNEQKHGFMATLMIEPNRTAARIMSPEEWMDLPAE